MVIGSEKNGQGKKSHRFGGRKALSVFFVRVRREQGGGSEIWEESRNFNIILRKGSLTPQVLPSLPEESRKVRKERSWYSEELATWGS